MIQKITIFLMVLCLELCFMAAATAHANPGLVSVDSVDAEPGDIVSVPVRLSDFIGGLYGFDMSFKFDTTKLTFVSGSFAGSVIPDELGRYLEYLPDSNKIWFRVTPTYDTAFVWTRVENPNGLLATFNFSVLQTAPSGMVPVDSMNRMDCTPTYCIGDFIYLVGESIVEVFPDFQSGGVNIKIPTAINDDTDPNLPDKFGLNQNYPNPFNPSTVIEFSLPQADHVKLNVYNILGQEIDVLMSGRMSAGRHEVIFDGANHPSGIYFYRLQSTAGTETRKMILAK